jgi:sugar-specific transcriptional regulator TrmB
MEIDEVLKEIGFNEYKAKIYKTLLSLVTATPREIGKEANVPVTRAYGVLEELAKEGFVVVLPGKPVRYRALPLSSAILPILETKANKIKELEEKVKKAEEEIALSPLPKKEILFFQGWDVIRKVIKKDVADSNEEVLFFIKFGKIERGIFEELEKAVKRKVKVRVLGPYTKERELSMYQYKKIGCKVKVINDLGLPLTDFSLFDKKILDFDFFSHFQKREELLVRIEDEITLKLFKQIFEKLWESAENLK